ncbi:MAG: hypothetical protein WCK05_06615 [Planctomycetota bacterium]
MPQKAPIMDFKHDTSSRPPTNQAAPAPFDQAAMYRRAIITKIRLRQAIFRARHLAPEGAETRRTAEVTRSCE